MKNFYLDRKYLTTELESEAISRVRLKNLLKEEMMS